MRKLMEIDLDMFGFLGLELRNDSYSDYFSNLYKL